MPLDNVPEANQPGHHPDHEQDKPAGRPPHPRTVAERFPFRFAGPVGGAARAFVLTPERAYVEIDAEHLRARYGPWRVTTPVSNITGTEITGPYAWWKVIGPAHLSFADRGLTFATNAERGVCIEFEEPVPGMEPTGRLRHPALTVTVDDPEALVAAISKVIDERS